MKKISILLFITGLLLEILSFCISQADNIPSVLRLTSPKFVKAKSLIETLEQVGKIEKKDKGFTVISQLIGDELRLHNPAERLMGINTIEIKWESTNLIPQGLKKIVKVKLSNGQELEWDLESLVDRINGLKMKNIFHFAIGVFIFGVILQIIGFLIEIKKNPKSQTFQTQAK